MNYREKYTDAFGTIPENWIIHHIGHDRGNNEISNLIALPKKTHYIYHFLNNMKLEFLSGLEESDIHKTTLPDALKFKKNMGMALRYSEIIVEIQSAIQIKDMFGDGFGAMGKVIGDIE